MDLKSESSQGVTIKIPWDSNTFRGFIASLVVLLIVVLLFPYIPVEPVRRQFHSTADTVQSIPLEVLTLVLGKGDPKDPNPKGGDLQEEGASRRADKDVKTSKDNTPPRLAKNNSSAKNAKVENNPNLTDKITPVKEKKNSKSTKDSVISKHSNDKSKNVAKESSNTKNATGESNTSTKSSNTGVSSGTSENTTTKGTENGNGSGEKGNGPGKGTGFGDISWGGGGNRSVTSKVIPKVPSGVNTSSIIKIRFWVSPDGIVTNAVPSTRGEPRLEQAAVNAIMKWRFNPVQMENDMVGVIAFNFQIN